MLCRFPRLFILSSLAFKCISYELQVDKSYVLAEENFLGHKVPSQLEVGLRWILAGDGMSGTKVQLVLQQPTEWRLPSCSSRTDLEGGYLFGLPVGFIADSIGATTAFILGRTNEEGLHKPSPLALAQASLGAILIGGGEYCRFVKEYSLCLFAHPADCFAASTCSLTSTQCFELPTFCNSCQHWGIYAGYMVRNDGAHKLSVKVARSRKYTFNHAHERWQDPLNRKSSLERRRTGLSIAEVVQREKTLRHSKVQLNQPIP
ncbi:hypothetical protein Ancab_019502 [Ancistrocladus abbreviatus]